MTTHPDPTTPLHPSTAEPPPRPPAPTRRAAAGNGRRTRPRTLDGAAAARRAVRAGGREREVGR